MSNTSDIKAELNSIEIGHSAAICGSEITRLSDTEFSCGIWGKESMKVDAAAKCIAATECGETMDGDKMESVKAMIEKVLNGEDPNELVNKNVISELETPERYNAVLADRITELDDIIDTFNVDLQNFWKDAIEKPSGDVGKLQKVLTVIDNAAKVVGKTYAEFKKAIAD